MCVQPQTARRIHDRPIVRKTVQRSRADNRDAMQKRRINAALFGKTQISLAERVEGDGEPARGRTGQGCEHVGRDREGDQRTALD